MSDNSTPLPSSTTNEPISRTFTNRTRAVDLNNRTISPAKADAPIAPVSPAIVPNAPETPLASSPDLTAAASEPATPDANAESPAQPNVEPANTNPAPKEDRYAERFARLARKEKAAQELAATAKQERQALEADRRAIEQFKAAQAQYKTNPLALIKSMGLEWNEVLQYALNHTDDLPTAKDVQEQRLAQLESVANKYAEQERQHNARLEQLRIDEAVNRYKADLTTFARQKADQYELVNLHEAYDDAFAVVERTYEKTNRMMPMQEALDMVERSLLVQAQKSQAAKKLKPVIAAKQDIQAPPATTRAISPTITAKLTGAENSTSTPYVKPRRMSRQDEVREAIARMKASPR